MRKRIISLLLAITLLISVLPTITTTATAASTLGYAPYANVEYGYSDGVTVGTIRYIQQIPNASYYYSAYWPSSTFGGYAGSSTECGTASISMALSYVGVNETPKHLLESTNGYTAKMWTTYGDTTCSSIGTSATSISSAMNNYIDGNGKYSPLVIQMTPYPSSGNQHFVILAGKISDNTYFVVDPARPDGWTMTVSESSASLSWTSGTYPITSVHQWYNPNASRDTPPVISNVQITDMNGTGFTISCTVTDDTGVDRVQFPTWTDYNGQDDLFSDWSISEAARGTKNGDTYTYRVNIADHNYETEGYITHIYAFDNNGNQAKFDEPILQYVSVVCNHNFTNYESNGDATCTEDGTKTAKCDHCGETSTVTDEGSALGHSYESAVTEGNCQTPGFTTFTCSKCGDTYTVYDGEVSEWSTTKPAGVDGGLIETKTQYRYADKETTTSYDTSLSGWTNVGSSWQQSGSGSIQYVKSWPSGFSTSHSLYSAYNKTPLSASETATDKTVINSDNVSGYLYYHWCRGSYANGPINRGSKPTQQGEFTAFHAFFSTTSPGSLPAASDGDGSYQYSNGDCCKDTYWYFCTPVNTQAYTTYRNLFTYERWGNWSDWSDTVYSASESRKVESRTLYRYVTPNNSKHSYSDGYCTVCGAVDPDYEFVPAVITPDDVSGVPGSTVTIPVMIKQNPGFSGFTFVIDYDHTALSLTDISKGDVLKASESGSFTKNVSDGVVTWTDIENLTDNGELLVLTFKILDDAVVGSYEISLELKDGQDTNFVDENARAAHVEFAAGTVSVTEPKPVVTLTKIEITKTPTKTVYQIGESLDTTGLTLKATYSDGTTKTITSDFTTSGFDSSTAGTKTVTVSYEGKTASFTVAVEEAEEVDPDAPQIVVSNATGIVGQQVNVTIALTNNPGVASMMLTVGYDSNALTLVSVTDGGQLGAAVHSDNYAACPYTLTWANDLATENYTYNGNIVMLTFRVAENAELGQTSVTVYYDYENFDIFNVDGEEVWFEMINGSVNIIDALIGDVNSDGKVNTQDRMILTRYLAKWTGYTEDMINMTAADVNCDGKVNTQDRMILTRYLAKWTSYEELPYSG